MDAEYIELIKKNGELFQEIGLNQKRIETKLDSILSALSTLIDTMPEKSQYGLG